MKWWEFTQDNGDGSYSKLRFRTEEEAKAAKNWLEENVEWWDGDGEGISKVDTDSPFFFDSLEDLKDNYGPV